MSENKRVRVGEGANLVYHLLALEGALALEGVGHNFNCDMAAIGVAVGGGDLQLDRFQLCEHKCNRLSQINVVNNKILG